MIDPLRLVLQKRIVAAIEEVTPDNGYQHDLAGRVFRGRIAYGSGDPIPMISLLEPPLPLDRLPAPDDSDAEVPWIEMIVQGFVADDHQNPTDPAQYIMADVKKALAVEKRKVSDGLAFGLNSVTKLEIGTGTVRPPDEYSAKAYFWLSLRVQLVEDNFDPYNVV